MTSEREIFDKVRRKFETDRMKRDSGSPATPEPKTPFLKRNWMLVAAAVTLGVLVGVAIFMNIGDDPIPDRINRTSPAAVEAGESMEYDTPSVYVRFRKLDEVDEEPDEPETAPGGMDSGY
ncbi:MAG: hypothetical protein ACYTAF_08315 [Planctomycetota bacterium]|jgi:hypothetical protein